MLDKETIRYLDSLSDAEFIFLIHLKFGATLPQWVECTKEEYEKYCGKNEDKITMDLLERLIDNMCNGREYRRVPIWNNGGGIMDQISGREPDGYHYEKCTGYKKVLMMGGDMVDYCSKRKCMKSIYEAAVEYGHKHLGCCNIEDFESGANYVLEQIENVLNNPYQCTFKTLKANIEELVIKLKEK